LDPKSYGWLVWAGRSPWPYNRATADVEEHLFNRFLGPAGPQNLLTRPFVPACLVKTCRAGGPRVDSSLACLRAVSEAPMLWRRAGRLRLASRQRTGLLRGLLPPQHAKSLQPAGNFRVYVPSSWKILGAFPGKRGLLVGQFCCSPRKIPRIKPSVPGNAPSGSPSSREPIVRPCSYKVPRGCGVTPDPRANISLVFSGPGRHSPDLPRSKGIEETNSAYGERRQLGIVTLQFWRHSPGYGREKRATGLRVAPNFSPQH